MAKRLPAAVAPAPLADLPENPRAVIGGNRPPIPTPDEIKADLVERFAGLLGKIKDAAEACKARTRTIETDEEQIAAADAYKALDACLKEWDAARVGEKSPYMQAERAVDGHFKPIEERIAAILGGIRQEIGAHLARKAARERAAKDAEARRVREEEARQRQEQERLQREAAEAARKAEEARTRAQRERAASDAERLRSDAKVAQATADTLDVIASNREAEAAGKPADLARTRGDASLSTLAENWDFRIVDMDAIPLNDLRPWFKLADVEKAIRGYVKANRDRRPLAGVEIFPTTKAQIR